MTMNWRELQQGLASTGYIADGDLAMAVALMGQLERPLLIEGETGVGKTDVAKALATVLGTRLIRLQCYEGLDANATVYEWNYQRQLLAIKVWENEGISADEKESHVFEEKFLLKRPLLDAITQAKAPVLLVDEIDRADEEFEAYLLEVLSDYQISIPEMGTVEAVTIPRVILTIPEMGTVEAVTIPRVILTSNSTRELSDALRRRCLYYWLDFPAEDKELRIVNARLPEMEQALAGQVVAFIARLSRRGQGAAHRQRASAGDGTGTGRSGGGIHPAIAARGFGKEARRGGDPGLGALADGDRGAQYRRGPGGVAPYAAVFAQDALGSRVHGPRGRRPPGREGGMSALAHSADTDPGAARILRRILGFARLARSNGFRVGIEESADALRVANVAGALDKRALRFGLRALFCSCTTDWGKFDELFDLYWRDVGRRSAMRVRGASQLAKAGTGSADAASQVPELAEQLRRDMQAETGNGEDRQQGASDVETLAGTDFRYLNDADALEDIYALTERLAARMRWRLTRRYRARSRGRVVDLRKTIHKSLRYGSCSWMPAVP
jgi:MoxR-like ATPase